MVISDGNSPGLGRDKFLVAFSADIFVDVDIN